MKKKLALILTLVLSVVSLNACGGSSKGSQPAVPAQSEVSASDPVSDTDAVESDMTEAESNGGAEASADPFPSLQNGDLTIIWHTNKETFDTNKEANPGMFDAVWSVKDAFEAKYGGTVNVIAVPWGEMKDTLITMVSSGEVCDLAEANDQNFPVYPAKNLVQPLDDIIDSSLDAFLPSVSEAFSYGGKIYAVGSDVTATQVMYNKDLFATYGVKTPDEYYAEGNWNWEAFRTVAKELTDDTNGDGMNDQFGFGWWDSQYISWLASNGLKTIDYTGDTITSNYNNPVAIEAFQMEQDLFLKDEVIDVTKEGDYFESEFRNGKLAMTLNHGITGYREVTFELGTVPFPRGPKVTEDCGQGLMTGWAIPITSANEEGAAAFAYMSSKARAEILRSNLQEIWDEPIVERYENALDHVQFSPIGIEKFWDANWEIHSNIIGGTPVSTFAARAADIINEGVKITLEQ